MERGSGDVVRKEQKRCTGSKEGGRERERERGAL